MSQTLASNETDYANSGWLQALMGAHDPLLQQARLNSKKCLDWIDCLTSLTTIREKAESLDANIESLWKYGTENELQWLLFGLPVLQKTWILESTDDFTIEQNQPPTIETAQQWASAMGIRDWSTEVTMKILSGDFVSWQRRVARQGSSAPTGFTMEASGRGTLELKTTASWKANEWVNGEWTFAIQGQPNMVSQIEEPIAVARPSWESIQDNVLLTLQSADERFAKLRKKPGASSASTGVPSTTWGGWCQSVATLEPLHLAVLDKRSTLGSAVAFSPVFQFVWAAIWPMVYCRRKRLKRGTCGLTDLRKRLDQCFYTDPALVSWLLVFGELLFQFQVADGIGIAAKFKDNAVNA